MGFLSTSYYIDCGAPARMVAGSSVARDLLNYQNFWDIIKLQWVQGYGPGEEFIPKDTLFYILHLLKWP